MATHKQILRQCWKQGILLNIPKGWQWYREPTSAGSPSCGKFVEFHAIPLAFGRLHRQNSRLFFDVPFPEWFSSVANIKSAIKRARQTVVRRTQNMAARSALRTAIKNVLIAVQASKKEEAINNLKVAVPLIDSMVNKGIIHRNKAARHKSQLNARVKALG